jgi:hypothetical protein
MGSMKVRVDGNWLDGSEINDVFNEFPQDGLIPGIIGRWIFQQLANVAIHQGGQITEIIQDTQNLQMRGHVVKPIRIG